MITLEKSKKLLLEQIESSARIYIDEDKIYPKSPEEYERSLRKLMEIYILVAALPVSNHLFEWYRSGIENVQIKLCDDKVRIIKVEGQYIEQIEFIEGDICNLMYKAFESIN